MVSYFSSASLGLLPSFLRIFLKEKSRITLPPDFSSEYAWSPDPCTPLSFRMKGKTFKLCSNKPDAEQAWSN